MRDTAEVQVLTGLSVMADDFDLLICDVWGVVHDGMRAHAAACDALARFRAGGGTVVLVSNAPRPAASIVPQLDELRVPRTVWDAIVTSGDIARAEIVARPGQPVYHLGPDRDLPVYEGLDAPRTGEAKAAYVVCTGLFDDDTETAEDYRDSLARLAGRGVVLICANPDLVVERGDRLIPCAGALAALYETLGGSVIWAGKPHQPIYDAALRRAAALRGRLPAMDRVLCIGDAIRTDIAGAVAMGFPSLLVARGIHAHELVVAVAGDRNGGTLDIRRLAAWLGRQTHRPDAVVEALAW